jgi:[acyl-carrier-protein] S-malonyltransferase
VGSGARSVVRGRWRRSPMDRVAFLFPGQGSQSVGMGRDLYDQFPKVRELYEQASEAIGVDLARITFEGPEEELTKTVNAQPALLVASVSALTLLLERDVVPHAVAGHSLGEYAALVAARSVAFPDAVKAVRERGRLMYEAGEKTRGTMAAVIGLTETDVAAVVEESRPLGVLGIANLNAPTQIVISGELPAVAHAMDLAKSRGAERVIELKVSGAFHSDLLAGARTGMQKVLAGTTFERPQCLFAANVTGALVEEPEAIRRGLVEQVTSTVRWVDCVKALAGRGTSLFVEVGPGSVLRGLMRKIEPVAKTMGGGTLAEIEKLFAAVGA